MTTIYLVQGEHYNVPGRAMSAHASREGAEKAALELVNIILKDLGKKLAKDHGEGLKRIQKAPGGDEADVWITELAVAA